MTLVLCQFSSCCPSMIRGGINRVPHLQLRLAKIITISCDRNSLVSAYAWIVSFTAKQCFHV